MAPIENAKRRFAKREAMAAKTCRFGRAQRLLAEPELIEPAKRRVESIAVYVRVRGFGTLS